MGIKKEKLGFLSVDAGDVVCFSVDSVMRIIKKMNNNYDPVSDFDQFVDDFDGVSCRFNSDGGYQVDKVTGIDLDGNTFNMVIIGLPDNFQRLLDENEPTYNEFYESHPDKDKVGQGEHFNKEIFDRISKEHSDMLCCLKASQRQSNILSN